MPADWTRGSQFGQLHDAMNEAPAQTPSIVANATQPNLSRFRRIRRPPVYASMTMWSAECRYTFPLIVYDVPCPCVFFYVCSCFLTFIYFPRSEKHFFEV
uniref:Uncharacterized protein n=1 Tax=Ciona intestinalis TaxID=7719 RepID=H2XUH8_CIOIN